MLQVIMNATQLAGVKEIFAQADAVLEAYLFGSRARGHTHAHSDFDFAVYLEPASKATQFAQRIALVTDLTALLKTEAVDLVVLNDATPLLYHRVLRDGQRLMSRDLARTTDREALAHSKYADDLSRQKLVREVIALRDAS